ncbi:MAG: hypothetical protein KDD53_02455 [Bdellovibrionales bacterium]|nr:hypothetical protein [Bdellovibrionales bacterium]
MDSKKTEHKESKETLRQYAESILALEQFVVSSLNKQLKTHQSVLNSGEYSKVSHVLEEVQGKLMVQVEDLHELIDEQLDGGKVAVMKESIGTATATLSGLFARLRAEPVSKLVRDTYLGLCALTCGYTMFYSSALATDKEAIAKAALKRLKELTPLVVHLSEALPFAVVAELELDAAKNHPALARLAKFGTREAWAGEHVHSPLTAE